MINFRSTMSFELLFLLFAFATTIIALVFYYFPNIISKSRLARAIRPGVGQAKITSDLPSIARARYSFLKNRKHNGGTKNLIGFFSEIESLLFSSGLKWRLSSVFIVIFFLYVVFFLIFFLVAQISKIL